MTKEQLMLDEFRLLSELDQDALINLARNWMKITRAGQMEMVTDHEWEPFDAQPNALLPPSQDACGICEKPRRLHANPGGMLAKYVSYQNNVMSGNSRVAVAISATMAKRIAQALSRFTPRKRHQNADRIIQNKLREPDPGLELLQALRAAADALALFYDPSEDNPIMESVGRTLARCRRILKK